MNTIKLYEDFQADDEIITKFRNLTAADFHIKTNKASYGVMQLKVIPKDKELKKAYSNLLFNDLDIKETTVDVETDNFNRLHIDGIPFSLRGMGIGRKIYQAVIAKLNMISTSDGSSEEEVKYIWDSLCKRPEYTYFKSGYRTILVLNDYAKEYYPKIKAFFGDAKIKTNYVKEVKLKTVKKLPGQLELDFKSFLPK